MSSDVARRIGPHDCLMLLLAAPRRRNALTPSVVSAISAALVADPDRTVVLASATPGIFCAGADLKCSEPERAQLSDDLYALYERVVTRPGVVIALVDGAAVGGGAQLAAAADIRIITNRARFRWVGPGHGLAVGAWILPELVGRSAALELTLTSRWVEADEAVRLGLATSIATDVDQRLSEVVAALVPGQPGGALGRVKRISQDLILDRLRLERTLNADAWDGKVMTPDEMDRSTPQPEPPVVRQDVKTESRHMSTQHSHDSQGATSAVRQN